MQNIQFSNYIIAAWDQNSAKYKVVHGYLGSYDEFEYELGKKIAEKDESILDEPDYVIEYLLNKGYLYNDERDEEAWLDRVAKILHKNAAKELQVSILPTYECNFECPYCYEGSNKRKKTMSLDMVANIFSCLDKYEGKISSDICLFGGEPLLKENYDIVKRIVLEGNKRGYRFFAASNGFDLDIFDDLLNPELIYMIQTTLDGTENYHDSMRCLKEKKPTFQKIIKNINRALQKKVKIKVRTNVSLKNLVELEKLIEFYQEQGWIDNPYFKFYFSPIDNCTSSVNNKGISQSEIYKYLEEKENLLVKPIDIVGVYSDLYERMKKIRDSRKLLLLQAEACSANRNTIYIDPEGNMYPCCNIVGTSYTCGKLQNNEMILNSIYTEWNERTVFHMQACRKCAYALFCGGGCTAKIVRSEQGLTHECCADIKEIVKECIRNL